MALASFSMAAATRDRSRACARRGQAQRLIAVNDCSRRSALLASVATVSMSQLASEPREAAAAELPLVPKAPLTADLDISQVSKAGTTGRCSFTRHFSLTPRRLRDIDQSCCCFGRRYPGWRRAF